MTYSKNTPTNSFHSLDFYITLTRSPLFMNTDWGWVFTLHNYNTKISKTFLPFVDLFKALEREGLDFIWVYDDLNDELLLAIERRFTLTNPEFAKLISEVYKRHKDGYILLPFIYRKFDIVFNQVRMGYAVKWCVSKNFTEKI